MSLDSLDSAFAELETTVTSKAVAIGRGCTISRIGEADLEDLAELIDAINYLESGYQGSFYNALVSLFEIEDLENNGVILRQDAGTVVAFAWLTGGSDRELEMHGGVHPAWRNRGMGSLIVQWCKRRALAWSEENPGPEPLTVVTYAASRDNSEEFLFRDQGFNLVQRSVDLFCLLNTISDEVSHYSDIKMVPLTVDLIPALWQLYADSVQTILGQDNLSETEFLGMVGSGEYFAYSWLAVQDGKYVGYVLNRLAEDDTGFTESLGILMESQELGVERYLLKTSLQCFAANQLTEAWVKVVGGASLTIDMFRSLGYQVETEEMTYLWRP